MEGWRAGAFVVYALDTPGAEFRENSRERGARSPAYRSQRFDPPSRGIDFRRAKRESVPGRGSKGGSVAWGRGQSARERRHTQGDGRRGTRWAGWPGKGGKRRSPGGGRGRWGRSGATWRQRRGFCSSRGNGPGGQPGPTWGQIWAAAGLPGRFQTFRGRFAGKNAGKTGAGGRKQGAARHRRGLFPARAGRGGRRFGKNTVIRRRKKLHKPRTVITDPGAGAGSRPRTRYISRPF